MEEINNKTKIILIVLAIIPIIIVMFFGGLIIVSAEEINSCGYNLKLNGTNVTMNNTTYISANTQRVIRIGNLSVNSQGIDNSLQGIKFYTDIIVVFNGKMENYTSTMNGITYSFTNLGYIGNVEGFGPEDRIWQIRLIWDSNYYVDSGNNDLMSQVFSNQNGYIQDTDSAVNYGVGMRVIGQNCGLSSNMNINAQQYGAIIEELKKQTTNINELQSKLNTIINYINTTNTKIEAVEGAINYNGEQGRINDNANTQRIIDKIIEMLEENKVCNQIDKTSILTDGKTMNDTGYVSDNGNFGITDYLKVTSKTKIKVLVDYPTTSTASLCFYNINKEYISCILNQNLETNTYLTIPTNASFVRFTIRKTNNRPQFEFCDTSQNITNQQNETIINSDIDDEDKEQVDDTEIGNYEEAEEDLMDFVTQADTSDLNIGIDSTTSSNIWTMITNLIQTNQKVFNLFISILSIGVIKLMLAR